MSKKGNIYVLFWKVLCSRHGTTAILTQNFHSLGKNLSSAGVGNRPDTNTNKQQQTRPPVAQLFVRSRDPGMADPKTVAKLRF